MRSRTLWRGLGFVGIDNDMRAQFFGNEGTTRPVVEELISTLPRYRHLAMDIRDRQGVRDLLRHERPDFIIHTAAQPSHDKAAAIPYDDFDVNAVGTMNLLVAPRFLPEDSLLFHHTNKVYGDRPNSLALVELEKRYDYANGLDGINEELSIDQSLHSLFGASKAAADMLCQEFGRYFQMPIGIFRGGCLRVHITRRWSYTVISPILSCVPSLGGPIRSSAIRESRCGTRSMPATGGWKIEAGKWQGEDVAHLFLHFFRQPRCGEVYNLGGGRQTASPSSKR